METTDLHEGNRDAWNRTSRGGYGRDIGADVALIRSGGTNLMPAELRLLGDLSGVRRAIHLQCSHGLDALSLLNLGAEEVVGIDISEEMLASAKEKSDALGARARWVRADVFDAPPDLDGTADLVHTGRGALCWMMDLNAWARVVARLLRPGGRVHIFEGHPLDFLWKEDAERFELRDGASYFLDAPQTERGFPYEAALEADASSPVQLRSRVWTLGQTVTALIGAGLRIERLEEFSDPFWDQFKRIPEHELRRLPHTFGLLARKP